MTAAQRASAASMLERKGQVVTITHRESGAYDPATGSATVTETTQAASGVILPFPQGIRKMVGSDVLATDRQCYLSALKTDGATLSEPAVNDILTDTTGDDWTITEVSPLTPAGLDIIYELTIRGSGA